MRKKIAAGNWKMNLRSSEVHRLVEQLSNTRTPTDVQIILAAPFVYLETVRFERIRCGSIVIRAAAQNCHFEDNGAYTGEVSASMLYDIGIEYVIIGHSERRQYFNETHDILQKKISAALRSLMIPIFCCGEPLNIREKDAHRDYVETQLRDSLFSFSAEQLGRLIIAYEPIWAIGTGVTASREQAQEMHAFIRDLLRKQYGDKFADDIPILYGGSVKPNNAKELFAQPDVDGGLVGGASLKADSFLEIINSFSK